MKAIVMAQNAASQTTKSTDADRRLILLETRIFESKIREAKAKTKSSHAHRLVDFLFTNGPSSTTFISRSCGIGNISDAANRIRPALRGCGIDLVAILPNPPIRNRYGERSQAHIWFLQSI